MNQLVIVGNGFDLAHGMNSSFSDFAKKFLPQLKINGCSL